jgi:hypothetical protein
MVANWADRVGGRGVVKLGTLPVNVGDRRTGQQQRLFSGHSFGLKHCPLIGSGRKKR